MTQTQVSGSGIKNNVITNNHLHSAANISGSKLADSGVTAGSYGSGSATLSLTINAQGLITAASTNAITQVGGSNGVDFNDNVKARFGTGNDLQIYHEGSHSFIDDNGTGNLQIRTNGTKVTLQGGTNAMLNAIKDGAVELYHNNSKKFETLSYGAKITGSLTATNNINNESDTGKLMLGASNDLQLFHNGSNSFLTNLSTGGFLHIRSGSGINLQDEGGNENFLKCIDNGAVELYHNGTKKFETTNYGALLTGQLYTTDYIYIDNEKSLFLQDNGKLLLGTGNDLQIYHDGTRNIVEATGQLRLCGTTNVLLRASTFGDVGLNYIVDGGVELFYDNSKKLETVTGGVYVYGDLGWGIGGTGNLFGGDNSKIICGNGNDLQIYHDGTSSYVSNRGGNLYIESKAGETAIQIIPDGAVDLRYDGSKKIETTSTGIKVTGVVEASGVPLQQVFNNTNTSLTKTGTGTVSLGFSSMSMTTKRSNSLLVFSYTISGEIDGNRGQCFYRLFYSTNSNYSGEQAVNNTCFQGNSHNVSDGDFSDSGTFHFTNPVSAGTTIYLRMKYSNSNSGASIEFNQQSLTNQPSGTTNISFFRLEELTT